MIFEAEFQEEILLFLFSKNLKIFKIFLNFLSEIAFLKRLYNRRFFSLQK